MVTNNSWNAQYNSTDGQLLIGNSSTGIPTAATLTAGSNVTITNGHGTITIASSASAAGTIVGQARTSSTTKTFTVTTMAVTGTTPTTSNTVLLLSLSYTPASASNILYFNFDAPCACGDGIMGFYLFAGTTLLASFPTQLQNTTGNGTANIQYYAVSGTTSATTYAVYYTGGPTNAGFVLQTTGSTAFYGGTVAMVFTVTEVKP